MLWCWLADIGCIGDMGCRVGDLPASGYEPDSCEFNTYPECRTLILSFAGIQNSSKLQRYSIVSYANVIDRGNTLSGKICSRISAVGGWITLSFFKRRDLTDTEIHIKSAIG